MLPGKRGIDVVFVREEGTPFFTATMALFCSAMLRNKKIFLPISDFDVLITKTLGRIIPFFRAGEILLLARQGTEK
jgi:hypothetical protein